MHNVDADDAEKFDQIVAYARENNPFYTEWLRDGVPILTRRVASENNDRILNGHPVTAASGGSTGIPIRISMSPRRAALFREIDNRCVAWVGGPLVTSHISKPRGIYPYLELDVKSPVEQQIAWLKKRYEHAGAVALVTYPTNAALLAAEILRGGHDLEFMRRVTLISESFEPEQRAQVQRAFPNALIWSTYSAVEFGIISAQCPFAPDFHHIMSDCLRVEVLDENDGECAPGQTGRVIVTDYFNDWAPLIRYEIGDLAVRGHCPCGQIALPAFSAVLGKVSGALLHRSGQRVPFIELSYALRGIPGMKQYQVVQEELERFTVRLVMDQPREEEIAAAFEAHFGYRPRLEFEYREILEREPNGKFHKSICRV